MQELDLIKVSKTPASIVKAYFKKCGAGQKHLRA